MVAGMDDSVALPNRLQEPKCAACAEDSLLRFCAGHPLWKKEDFIGGGIVVSGGAIDDDGLLQRGCLCCGIALQGGMPLERGGVPGVDGGEGAAAQAVDHVHEKGNLGE